MTEPSTALLAAVVALVVALITSRSSARVAAGTRSWERRADLYMEVVRWLNEEMDAVRARETYRMQPLAKDVELGLLAFGSEPLDRRLRSYRRARDRAVADLQAPRRRAAMFLRMRLIHLQIRAELGSPLGLADRFAFALVGSPVVAFLLAYVLSVGIRRGEEPPVLVPDPAS